MKVRFLGKDSRPGDSPTLYATDRETYVIQGYKVTDLEILAKLDIPEGETCVEITSRLLTHLTKDGLSGVVTSWVPPIVHVLESGNLIIQGKKVFNGEILGHMIIPLHEDCVEVAKAAVIALLEEQSDGADHA